MKCFLAALMSLALLTIEGNAADALYHNIGTVDCGNAPQVDAFAFVNDGRFCAEPLPALPYGAVILFVDLPNPGVLYTTQNTLSFTNNGLMQSSPGFELDYITPDGLRHPAAAIVNSAGGANGPANIFGSSFVLLSATNLVNKGLLEIGSSGLMQLSGNSLNLARGGLLVDPAGGSGGGCEPGFFYQSFISPTNYAPENGLDDLYWGLGTLTNLASDQVVQQFGNQLIVQSPPHAVTNVGGFSRVTVGPLIDPASFTLTNTFVNGTNTNWIVQAVFVGLRDTNVTARVRFVNNTYPEDLPPNNGFQTAIVELSSVATNVVTAGNINYTLYLVDQLATSTNFTSLTNVANGVTQRPATYVLNTFPPCDFIQGAISSNTTVTPGLIYNPAYSNRVVTASYAGYEAGVFLNSTSFGAPLALPTNSPGRIEITANNLDLSNTRIRSESIVTVETPHLKGSSGLIVDSPNINYNIGSTNGLLSVSGKDLAEPEVQRFGGFIAAWSGVWTNFIDVVSTNGTGTNAMSVTNTVEVDIHVLMLDASGIFTIQPVLLNDFSATGTNIVLNDTITAGRTVALDGDALTVNGTLTLAASDWASTNIHLNSLTNNGTINVADIGAFGTVTRPYSTVVNRGSIAAFAISVNTTNFEQSGAMSTGGSMSVDTRFGKIEGGRLSASGDMSISAQDLKLTGFQQSSAALYLSVINSLTDSGGGANNRMTCNNGFHLLVKPKRGDLFGTTLETATAQFAEADSEWAAEDRGPVVAGFSDNAVVGHLVLSPSSSGLVTFSGTGASNALYVDFLELGVAARANLQSLVAINTNLVIYFADANVPVETLDGQFADSSQPGGRLRWVKEFAGPNSSVDVLLLSGQTVKMNRSLRFSLTIDSDGDGVVNGYDAYPLDAAQWNALTLLAQGGGQSPLKLSLTAAPGATYQVESTTNLAAPNWQIVTSYTHLSATSSLVTITPADANRGEVQRYYRVRSVPQ